MDHRKTHHNGDEPLAIDAAALSAAIAGLARFHAVSYLATVDSTNSCALQLIRSADSAGMSIVAESQSAGRGRAGRLWTSPPRTGLLLSTIMPTELSHETLPALGFWASLAAADAVEVVSGFWPALKWPNDLQAGPAKLAGILLEGETVGTASRMVVGVGVNVNRPSDIPADLTGKAVWLSDLAGRSIDRTKLAAALLQRYDSTYDRLIAEPRTVIRDWAARAACEGQRITVSASDGSLMHEGIAQGIGDDGALLLQTSGGLVRVTLGDVQML